jgi:hypothetical protein
LFAFAHVFYLIGDMFDVQRVETPGPEQLSLFVGPSDHVVVVTVHSAHLLRVFVNLIDGGLSDASF